VDSAAQKDEAEGKEAEETGYSHDHEEADSSGDEDTEVVETSVA